MAAIADGGLFWEEDRGPAATGDFTGGGALGIDWQSISVALEAGYNLVDRGLVWGVGFRLQPLLAPRGSGAILLAGE